ncbi:MAG: tetratricopeptide repeat protein [Crocosphaera sp.]
MRFFPWLRNIAQWLTGNVNPKEGNIETYQNFLQQLLQAEIESKSDVAVVYPLLKQHQHLLDDVFAQLLPKYARNLFSQSNPEDVSTIAGVIQNLCIDINQFPLGSRADNLEIAIKGYETVLEVYPRDAFPQDWAMTQNNLGTAYLYRIRGEKADNLEEAIAAYERSLEVYTRDAFPQDWATTQNNLGTAYNDRIRGERADNLEEAIAAYERSLEVRTRDAFPQDWAMTQNNLGTAYTNRIEGDATDNLEIAISCYQQALNVRTLKSFPLDWADTQYNLGNAYSRRSIGDETENLNQAIICYENVLKVYTGKTFPDYWAQIKYNLGNSYRQRFQLLNNPEDIKQGILAYQQAKAIFEKTANADLIFDSYYQLAKTFFEGGYYTDAIQHLETCSQTYRKSKNVPHLAPILFELARVYHRMSRLEKARLNFKDSLRLFRRLGDEENTYSVMVSLSNLEIQTGKIEQAYDHLKEAQIYYQNHTDPKRLDEINNLLNILQLN